MTPEAAINNFKIFDFFYAYIQAHPFNLYDKLKKINKQTLIITGDQDVVPLHYMEKLHASLPSSTYKVIKDCGHFAYIDQPDILFDEIKSFL
jgi:proline iminopeptidase